MERYIRGNKIGVLISPGYGSSFSTWVGNMEMAIDRDLIEAFLDDDEVEMRHIIETKYDNPYIKVDNLVFGMGRKLENVFMITEYDGHEEVLIVDDNNSLIA
jgi:hypothetical protein